MATQYEKLVEKVIDDSSESIIDQLKREFEHIDEFIIAPVLSLARKLGFTNTYSGWKDGDVYCTNAVGYGYDVDFVKRTVKPTSASQAGNLDDPLIQAKLVKHREEMIDDPGEGGPIIFLNSKGDNIELFYKEALQDVIAGLVASEDGGVTEEFTGIDALQKILAVW